VLTIQERWRFESIPNQLVIYSSHKSHSPIKWATDHQWQDFDKRRGINWGHSTQGPPDCQDAPWAHSSRPCPIPFSTSTCTRVGPGPNHVTSFTVARYFIWLAKCEACVQHDKRTSNDWSLIDTDGKLTAPQNPVWLLPTFPSSLQFSINTWLIPGYHAVHS
jgi:hypothetical protein